MEHTFVEKQSAIVRWAVGLVVAIFLGLASSVLGTVEAVNETEKAQAVFEERMNGFERILVEIKTSLRDYRDENNED
jgi:hypothetical protein